MNGTNVGIEPSLPLEGLSILAVDDEQDSLLLLQVILETEGAKVTTVMSTQAALKTLSSEHPDLLISDIAMPDEDGLALIRTVRALDQAEGGAIPAIALSALARELCGSECLAAGFQDYVAKPVEPQALIAAILNIRTLPFKSQQSFTPRLKSVA
jgi:CheY-like chemotaxis protein